MQKKNKIDFKIISLVSLFVVYLVLLGSLTYIKVQNKQSFVEKEPEVYVGEGMAAELSVNCPDLVNSNGTFNAVVDLEIENAEVDGVDVILNFNQDKFELKDISDFSIFGLFLPVDNNQAFDKARVISEANQNGAVSFGAITYNPGSGELTDPVGSDEDGQLLKLTFKAKADGNGSINFDYTDGSDVDSNVVSRTSGEVEDILTAVNNCTITIGECQSEGDCDDENPCTNDSCNNGQCEYTNIADGTSCDDNDECTLNDQCSNGSCTGTSKDCDDGIDCTVDSCEAGDCIHDDSNCDGDDDEDGDLNDDGAINFIDLTIAINNYDVYGFTTLIYIINHYGD
jgi:hypothetical protein